MSPGGQRGALGDQRSPQLIPGEPSWGAAAMPEALRGTREREEAAFACLPATGSRSGSGSAEQQPPRLSSCPDGEGSNCHLGGSRRLGLVPSAAAGSAAQASPQNQSCPRHCGTGTRQGPGRHAAPRAALPPCHRPGDKDAAASPGSDRSVTHTHARAALGVPGGGWCLSQPPPGTPAPRIRGLGETPCRCRAKRQGGGRERRR